MNFTYIYICIYMYIFQFTIGLQRLIYIYISGLLVFLEKKNMVFIFFFKGKKKLLKHAQCARNQLIHGIVFLSK